MEFETEEVFCALSLPTNQTVTLPLCGPPAGDALLWSRNQAALICSYHRQNMSLPSSPTQRFLIRLGSLPLQSSLKATVLT